MKRDDETLCGSCVYARIVVPIGETGNLLFSKRTNSRCHYKQWKSRERLRQFNDLETFPEYCPKHKEATDQEMTEDINWSVAGLIYRRLYKGNK